jgi:hypothetical protein
MLFSHFCYANDPTATQVAGVLGYQSATNNEVWQQGQVGFGVKSILEQALLDNTQFSLVDDKVLFGIKNENIEEELQTQWMLNENQTTAAALQALAEKHQLNDIFWVKITDFVTKTSKVSLAIFSSSEYNDTLTLEVCRYAVINHTVACEAGEATKSRQLTGVLYKPTDNVKKNFKDSGAGQLSQEAIQQALVKLLKL